jgi:hypothetical protein
VIYHGKEHHHGISTLTLLSLAAFKPNRLTHLAPRIDKWGKANVFDDLVSPNFTDARLSFLANSLTQLTSPQVAMPVKRVAVIGAGPAGAIAVDALAQEKTFDVIRVFERREGPGGCW